jgi:hypothetical protein
MPSAGFELAISAVEQLQTYASTARLLETLVGILVLFGLQSETDLLVISLRLKASLTAF